MAKEKMQMKTRNIRTNRKNLKERNKYSVRFIVVSIIVIAVIFLLLGVVSLLLQLTKTSAEKGIEGIEISPEDRFILADNATRISMQLPAVDSDGNGVITWLN